MLPENKVHELPLVNSPETRSSLTPTIPVVDAAGNIIAPKYNPDGSAYRGRLHLVSVFGQLIPSSITDTVDCSDYDPAADLIPGTAWDKYRTQTDPSGYISRFTDRMPDVNNYEIGDGLNVAGHKFTLGFNGSDNLFGVGEDNQRMQVHIKADHNFNDRHRLSVSYSYERDNAVNNFRTWPNGYDGSVARRPQMLSLNFTSTLSPTLLNEFRLGMSRWASTSYDPLDNPSSGSDLEALLKQLLPTDGFSNYSGLPILVSPGNGGVAFQTEVNSTGAFSSGINASNPADSQGNLAPTVGGHDRLWTYTDTMSWTKWRHSFKGGAEVRLAKSYQVRTGSGDANTYVEAVGGATQYAPVQGIDNANMPGIAGSISGSGSIGTMESLLNYMSGSLSNVRQYLYVNSPTASSWNSYSNGESSQVFDIRMREYSLFLKDDWKIIDSLTLNFGLRYEHYSVPHLESGMTVGLQGGSNSIFGVTGGDFSTWLVPDRAYDPAQLTRQIFIGPNSPNPQQQAYNDYWKDIGPSVGFAWQLPWLGKGKTILRGGWQMSWIGYWNSGSPASITGNTTLYANGAVDFAGPSGSFDTKSGTAASRPKFDSIFDRIFGLRPCVIPSEVFPAAV